ncbi:hypothetical protein LENED_000795 [Lentinula edodes]|uniref:Uncharacterized protein n=1 Tax=Lentinula edodes TaxID=5353 RepID=A0A1Q3DWH0_LENED|nr:hypothetical protein LENED_000795 [Lentinula edodes]
MPGSLDPSYFGRVDLKCLVPTRKGSYVVKKELVTGKISRRYPEQNEEVLISFKDGKPLFKNGQAVSEESPKKSAPEETQKKSSLSRVKTLFGKKSVMAVPIVHQIPDPKEMYLMSGGLSPDAPNISNATSATTNALVQHVEEDDHGHIHDDPYPIKGKLFVHPSLFEVGTPPELRDVMKNAIESMLEPIIPEILADTSHPYLQESGNYRYCLILEKEDNNKVSFEFQPELLTGKMGEDARLKNRLLVSFMDGKTVDVTRNNGLLSHFKSKTKGTNQGRSLYT